jgi:hypothetical protein
MNLGQRLSSSKLRASITHELMNFVVGADKYEMGKLGESIHILPN